ncbi:lipoyl synthase [Desulfitibacter alkalitolerans]|uniref:lipoyl synthase n=1 Tax=Desulfitibacter alkalitolerans TaxID=264641 RepID=UPI00047F3F7C|nr:lipoyl synthase [Desulfitibacter alkalitolerans]
MSKTRFPDWLKRRIPASANINKTNEILKSLNLNTVCESALCPNRGECFTKKTATFMILGNTCTRNCGFCAVPVDNKPGPVNTEEPDKIVQAVKQLGLKHVVITSVTRDDLSDGGAGHFSAVIRKLKEFDKSLIIEVLTPDFAGSISAIEAVTLAKPNIYNHNLETVPELYKIVRPEADYDRSLNLLKLVKSLDEEIYTKSGIMVGLGETFEQVGKVLEDLRCVNCDVVTIGQYLAPSQKHLEVKEFVHPEVFKEYEALGQSLGFKHVAAAPFVRSSFNADDFSKKVLSVN